MKKIYYFCLVANFLLLLYVVILVMMVAFEIDGVASFFSSELNIGIIKALSLPSFFLFIMNNIICYKKDSSSRGILLLLLNAYYSPFYSIRVIKKNWLD